MTAVFSRRGLLGAGVVAVGAGVAIGAAPAAGATASSQATASAASAAIDPLRPVRSQFADRIGAVFVGTSERSTHELVLEEVRDLPGGGDAENRYAVVFRADDGARDGTYRLTIDGAHVATLFFAAVSSTPSLEAIVDRSEAAS